MNARERFHEVMNFNTAVPALKWEFGYWGETLDNWYRSGLPKRKYPALAQSASTPTASLYQPAWVSAPKDHLPSGIAVVGGGLYWPTQSFPSDSDVREFFSMDKGQRLVNVNMLFHPMFEVKVHREDEREFVYTDIDGVKRIFLKDAATIPTGLDWPIKNRASWEQLKAERLNTNDLRGRFPANWKELLEDYRTRDYPLAIGGYPHGFFGTLAHLMGYEHQFINYLDQPQLMHDILKTFTDLWIAIYEEILSQIEVDMLQIWEDISAGTGPMISLKLVREFMCPYIRRVTDFVKSRGIKIILLDTDGDCNSLIPLFTEAGVTGMYPFETLCGMDIIAVRKQYPRLQMLGGIPKSSIPLGKDTVDRILAPVAEVLKTGGFIPFGDHLIPPEVHWEGFQYYRSELNGMIDAAATK